MIQRYRMLLVCLCCALPAACAGGSTTSHGANGQALLPASVTTAIRYHYVLLPLGFADGINNRGTIVGGSLFSIPNVPQLWQNGSLQTLSLPSDFGGEFTDINNAGVAVGTGGTPDSAPRLFLYANGRVIKTFATGGFAAINDAGDLAVNDNDKVTLYPRSGPPLHPFAGSAYASAGVAAMNNRGDYVGFFIQAGSTTREAYVAHGTVIHDLQTPGIADDINDSGTVIGYTNHPDRSTTGFLWTAKGGLVPFPAFPNAYDTTPIAINNRGEVVGEYGAPNVGSPRGFLYSGGSLYDLAALSDRGFTGTPAGINDRGDVVMDVLELPGTFLLQRGP